MFLDDDLQVKYFMKVVRSPINRPSRSQREKQSALTRVQAAYTGSVVVEVELSPAQYWMAAKIAERSNALFTKADQPLSPEEVVRVVSKRLFTMWESEEILNPTTFKPDTSKDK